jgi:hypothetical protein
MFSCSVFAKQLHHQELVSIVYKLQNFSQRPKQEENINNYEEHHLVNSIHIVLENDIRALDQEEEEEVVILVMIPEILMALQ